MTRQCIGAWRMRSPRRASSRAATATAAERIADDDLDASAIIVLVCNVDAPREMATLRRLRRECRATPDRCDLAARDGHGSPPGPRSGRGRLRLRVQPGDDAGGDGARRGQRAIRGAAEGARAASSAPLSPIASARCWRWSRRASPTPRSPSGCSSPRARSRATSLPSSASWAFAPAGRLRRSSSSSSRRPTGP